MPELDPNDGSSQDVPPIVALFVIYFDVKAGYMLGWKRSNPGVELAGVVEYKSLPSGLHNVKEDLVYFVHEGYAGISAFVNAPTDEIERNALLLAVGVLVPLSYGRLGRSWRHAQSLKSLSKLLPDRGIPTADADLPELEKYWECHHLRPDADENASSRVASPIESPSIPRYKLGPVLSKRRRLGHGRVRSQSDGTALQTPGLSPHHPALSLPTLLETFGPLVFPLHRAAVLRKRILIITHAPVELACNYVYDISILSNIPSVVSELLPTSTSSSRLRPFFTVGVHDIPLLEEEAKATAKRRSGALSISEDDSNSSDEAGNGWVACTTDNILAMKDHLYDVLIKMPPPHAQQAAANKWPTMVESDRQTEMKATQRDLRRYRVLRRGFRRRSHIDLRNGMLQSAVDGPADNVADTQDTQALLQKRQDPDLRGSDNENDDDDDAASSTDEVAVVEAVSWPALAYSSFMWWASAGEKGGTDLLEEEYEADGALLEGLDVAGPGSTLTGSLGDMDGQPLAPEMALVAYFHRVTSLMISTMSDILDSSETDQDQDDEDHAGVGADDGDDPVLTVSGDDMTRMGLDLWAAKDRVFVRELAELYFDREADVRGAAIECCGVRVL